jgi:hypothetical protein
MTGHSGDVSPEARQLLEASRGAGGPTAAQRTGMKRAVLAAALLPGTAAAATTVAGGAKATGLALAGKLGILVASIAVGSAVVWTAIGTRAVEVPAPLTIVQPSAERTEAPPPPVQIEVAPLVPVEIVPGVAVAPPAPVVPRVAVPRVESPSPVEPISPPPAPAQVVIDEATLSREVAALSGAMGAIDAKTYAVALEQISHYRAAFPAGLLKTEASVVEALALCGLGRVDEARRAADALPANNPAVRRLERSCVAEAGK